jgi:transcriptional regulator with XRE-family HTH domain
MARQAPTFGILLHSLRLGAGLTQQDLARRASVSVRALRDIEHGRRRVRAALEGTAHRRGDRLVGLGR